MSNPAAFAWIDTTGGILSIGTLWFPTGHIGCYDIIMIDILYIKGYNADVNMPGTNASPALAKECPMSYQSMIIPRVRPAAWAFALLAVLLLIGTACGRDPGAPTATPAFSLPTALPSPEAAPAPGSGAEATAATTSAYWDGPRTWEPEDVSSLERVTQELVAPPFLPEHEQIYDGEPRVVEVRMEIEEKEIEVAPASLSGPIPLAARFPAPSSSSTRATMWS